MRLNKISIICLYWALLFCGCTTNAKLHRATRPAVVVVRSDLVFTMPWGSTTDVRIPAGEYRYAWDDKGYWYYEDLSAQITANVKGRIPVTRPGGFAIAKEYDEIGLILYCERGDMYKRGVGDGVTAMMPKRDGKIVSWEGDIPKAYEQYLVFVGEVPR